MYSKIYTDSSYSQNNQFKSQILGKMLIISVIFTLTLALLDTLKINHIGHVQALNNYIHAGFVFFIYVLFKKKQIALKHTAIIFLFFCSMTSCTALFVTEHDSFRAIWFFLSTIIAFVFLGTYTGKVYGYTAMVLIAFDGFFLATDMNTTSIISTLVSFIVLVLIMSAYTLHMHKHLEKTDKIQQELYYLANKSEIFNALTTDNKASHVEKLLDNAQQLNHDFSLVYIEFSYADKDFHPLNSQISLKEHNEKLISILNNLISSSDVISLINNNLLYIAAPNKNEFSIKLMVNKIYLYFNEYGITIEGQRVNMSLKMSMTSLQPTDLGMRALHIRADKGLTKVNTNEAKNIIFVDI